MTEPIAFIDLAAQQRRLGDGLRDAIDDVLASGAYIMGPQVAELERALGEHCGARHVVTCANGTDALVLALMAWGVGPGDAVFVPAFTFVATAEAPAVVGAPPVFVDVDEETFNLDPDSLAAAIERADHLSLRARAVIPVDLFGLPADHTRIAEIAGRHGLLVLDDAAQGFGAKLGDRPLGTFGDATATSFFPAKPLGCYGDGGAVMTDDDDLAALMRSVRVHGKGSDKYDNVRIGLNARLDTMQAAILLQKLRIFPDELEERQRVAARYDSGLADVVSTPRVPAGRTSSWAQYTIRVAERSRVVDACGEAGIPVQIYYKAPLHRQSGYAHYPSAPGGCPVSESLAESVLSLPMHPYLTDADQERIIATIRAAVETR